MTWTFLQETVEKGSNKIKLIEPVPDWPIGSEIVIATTGDKFSPGESEVARIIHKSDDNLVLTLNQTLKFNHLSEKRTVGTGSNSRDIYLRAEVGILTRNVVFKGSNDLSWEQFYDVPQCPEGFNPVENAVQTCFLGRYGPELGSDQFGAIIFINAPAKLIPNEPETVIARISNLELYYVGQAFRIGRYPLHFHMNGDMPSSYVFECAVHKSFNRATNMHASNYVRIERNVIYDIMGGAYFLEDGVEIGNVFKYNLAVFVKSSSSLLNEDVTPGNFKKKLVFFYTPLYLKKIEKKFLVKSLKTDQKL